MLTWFTMQNRHRRNQHSYLDEEFSVRQIPKHLTEAFVTQSKEKLKEKDDRGTEGTV